MYPALVSNVQKWIIHGAGEGYSDLFSYFFKWYFTGCILIFEYLYFLLQSNKDGRHSLDLAINTFQNSGTQATVINSLQDVIQQYGDNHDTLSKAIISIIIDNRMCKSSPP